MRSLFLGGISARQNLSQSITCTLLCCAAKKKERVKLNQFENSLFLC